VGSLEGLARFDGVRFDHFDLKKLAGAQTNGIYSLAESSEGALWIGTYSSGLIRYRRNHFQAFTKQDGLSSNTVTSLVPRAGGGIWAGTRQGLNYADGRGIHRILLPGGPKSNEIISLFGDDDNSLWVSTRDGLFHFDGEHWTPYRAYEGLAPGKLVLSMVRDSDGVLRAAGEDALWRLDGHRFYTDPLAIGLHHARVLHRDVYGRIWVGVWNDRGVARIQDRRAEWLPIGAGIANIVNAMASDQEGNLWLASGQGLVQLRRARYPKYALGGDLAGSEVDSSTRDRNGDIWFSTQDHRLVRIRDGHLNQFGPFAFEITKISPATFGGILLCLSNGDIARFESGHIRKFIAAEQIGEGPHVLLQGGPDELWIGTQSGLFQAIGARNAMQIHPLAGLIGNKITALAKDPDGSLWVGTDHGLNHLHNGRVDAYTAKNGLSGDNVWSISNAPNGDIWAATIFGTTRIRHGKLTAFTVKEGLLVPDCLDAQMDPGGSIWIHRIDGLDRISASDLADFDAGRAHQVHPLHLGSGQGIEAVDSASPQFDSDGNLWVVTTGGLLRIDPNHLAQNTLAPKVAIASVVVDARPVNLDVPTIQLAPGPRRIDINYSGLSFSSPEQVQFKYRLEGRETDWTFASGTQRVATYTDLRPGDYLFRVMAANNDGLWSEQPAAVKFSVAPFFYQRPLFFALSVLALAVCLWLLFLLRLHVMRRRFEAVLQERTAERNRIARELHDTVLQGFSGLLLHLEAIANQMPEEPLQLKRRLRDLMTRTEHYLEDARLSIMELRASSSEGPSIGDRLRKMLTDQASRAGLLLEFKLAGVAPAVPGVISDALLRIGSEALSNIILHAEAKCAVVTLEFQKSALTLEIADDGKGFDVSSLRDLARTHFGITGMSERAREIGGELEIDSKAGSGTRIRVRIPLNNAPRPISRGEASLSAAPR
jgi:signal transduction histidine kinase/ligand-binding sensor domain-containing protein